MRPAYVSLRRGSLRTPLRSERRLVRAARVELTTFGSGGRRSIQLSYARNLTTLYARFERSGKQIRHEPKLALSSRDGRQI